MPSLYILAGPNGAGKSSIGPTFLPSSLSLPPFDGDKLKMIKQREFYLEVHSYKEAGKMADEFVFAEFERIYKDALAKRNDFAYEGHFTEASSWNLIQLFKEQGYNVIMYFFGLSSLELSQERVTHRAESGGHNVHPADIEKNYYGNLKMLDLHYDLLDELVLIDASKINLLIARFKQKILMPAVTSQQLPQWVKDFLPSISRRGWKLTPKLLEKKRLRKSNGKRL